MQIVAHRYEREPPLLRPGQSTRAWMDQTDQRHAYRCTPLSIANASGWELILPNRVEATWDGGIFPQTLKVTCAGRVQNRAMSHFGSGVITFLTGYLFRTPPGWALWARGAPNQVKDGVVPLDGLIETDWSPYTFTMNWKMTRPGTVIFEPGEVFCFLTPVPHAQLDDFEMTVKPLALNEQLSKDHLKWVRARHDFIQRLKQMDPATIAQAWMRDYVKGQDVNGEKVDAFHITRRKMKGP